MSEGMQSYYEKAYPGVDKFVPLIHTFEEWPVAENPTDVSATKDRYDFLLIGNFNNSNVEATARLVNALKDEPRINIKMFTRVDKTMLRMRGIDVDAIDYRGFVKQEDFYKELMDNDVCVLTHGFTGGYTRAEYETIFPTRTINFLVSGLPVFAHSPDFSFLTQFLKKYDCAEVVDVADPDVVLERALYLLGSSGTTGRIGSKCPQGSRAILWTQCCKGTGGKTAKCRRAKHEIGERSLIETGSCSFCFAVMYSSLPLRICWNICMGSKPCSSLTGFLAS